MTLNASGPLSLGGSTVGQSINLELGQSATALASINATNFRTLAGVASGQISISNFYGKSNFKGFIILYSGASGSYPSSGGAIGAGVDSSGNLYASGTFGGASCIFKHSATTGAVSASNNYTPFFFTASTSATACRSSIIFNGTTGYSLGLYASRWCTLQFTTTGPLTAATVGTTYNSDWASVNYQLPSSIARDASGNIYITCTQMSYGACCEVDPIGCVVKYNSSYTAQWIKTDVNSGSGPSYGYMVDGRLDSTDVFWTMSDRGFINKTNPSTGAATFSNYVNSPVFNAYSFAFDSSNNIYVLSNCGGAPYSHGSIYKINAGTQTVAWSRKITSGQQGQGKKIIVGGDGYIYAVGLARQSGSPAPKYGYIMKYDTSGTIQWQRTIRNSAATYVDSDQVVYDCVYTSSGLWISGAYSNTGNANSSPFTMLLPLDGSGTGTYTFSGSGGVTMVYAASTYTESAGTSPTLANSASYNAGSTNTSSLTPTTQTPSNTTIVTSLV